MANPPEIDENPFASPQEAGSSDLFCLTVWKVRFRELLQALVALLIMGLLVGFLLLLSQALLPSPGWAAMFLLWVLRLGALSALLTVLNHLYRLTQAGSYLPIRLTTEGIEAQCKLEGDPRIISWAWPDVETLDLSQDGTMLIISRERGTAHCDLRSMGRSDYKALREAVRARLVDITA